MIKKNKYGAKRTEVDGIMFHSKKEANYYVLLKCLKEQGRVKRFEMQKVFKFASGIKYILDFLVEYSDNTVKYIDVKGKLTDVYKLKKKLMKHEFGIEITEV